MSLLEANKAILPNFGMPKIGVKLPEYNETRLKI